MRLVLLAQVAIAAVLAASCSGADSADPSGGTSGAGNGSGQGGEGNGSSSGQGGAGNGSGQGGAGNGSGQGGAGNGSGQGGAGNGSSTGQGGAGNGSSTGQGGAGNSGAGGSLNEVCAMQKSDLDLKYVDAAACNPLSDTPQCKDTVSGPCSCQIVVALKNTPAVIAYLDAVKAWQSAGCDATCPPDPCPPMPTGVCTPQGAPNVGICVTQP